MSAQSGYGYKGRRRPTGSLRDCESHCVMIDVVCALTWTVRCCDWCGCCKSCVGSIGLACLERMLLSR